MTPRPAGTISWVVYDLANTIFALGVVGLYFIPMICMEGLLERFPAALSWVDTDPRIDAAPILANRDFAAHDPKLGEGHLMIWGKTIIPSFVPPA